MDIVQASKKYLNTLYLKSKDDFERGYSEKLIAKLLTLDRTEAQNVMRYAAGKNLLDTQNGFGDNVSLSPDGIDFVSKIRENKIYNTIKFKGVKYLPSSRDAIEFLYYYDLIDEDGTSEPKAIKVSISGSLSIQWGFQRT